MEYTDKIKTRKEILIIADKLRKEGHTIVTTNGSYDLSHAGHSRMLNQAKKQGTILIVGLNSDESIKEYKSKDRPIIPQQYRAEQMAALQFVDYVTIFDETTPMNFLKSVKPHVHVNHTSYGTNCIEAPLLKKLNTKLHLIGNLCDFSTTKIINKIKETTK